MNKGYILLSIWVMLSCGSDDGGAITNLPPVMENQTFDASESVDDVTVIGTVQASDPEDQSLSFSIAENSDDLFEITSSGDLSLTDGSSLDFETATNHTLTVSATDGENRASATVTIQVNDVDESVTPVIEAQTFTAAENISDTEEIGTVLATDPNGDALTFSITEDSDNLFEITPEGVLSLRMGQELDLEAAESHTLLVSVSDGMQSASATITIDVIADPLAFDITTAKLTSNALELFGGKLVKTTSSFRFSNDGTQVYVTGQNGSNNGFVFQLTLSTAYDLSTANLSYSLEISDVVPGPRSVTFNDDGTLMFLGGLQFGVIDKEVFVYNLSTAFDLSTASYNSVFFDAVAIDGFVAGIRFNNDGTKLFITGNTGSVTEVAAIHEYSLSTAYDVTTATYNNATIDFDFDFASPGNFAFNDDGSKLYATEVFNDRVVEYNLVTNFDLSTATESGNFLSIPSKREGSPTGLDFNSDGTELIIVGFEKGVFLTHNLSTAYDLSTASYSGKRTYYLEPELIESNAVAFNADGSKLFVADETIDVIVAYDLSTPFDINTASYNQEVLDVLDVEDRVSGFAFNTNGTKLYITGYVSDAIHQYSLGDPFDLSSATYDNVSIDVMTQTEFPLNLAFNNEGNKLYLVGSGSIHQYNLSTVFDLSTASYANVSLDVSAIDDDPAGLSFSANGNRLIFSGAENNNCYMYELSTAFDLSTASFNGGSLDLSSISTTSSTPKSLTFNLDGSKLFILNEDTEDASIYEFTVGGN